MKKIISIILVLIMVLSAQIGAVYGQTEQPNQAAPVLVSAEPSTKIEVKYNFDTKQIETSVYLVNNPGIFSLDSVLKYDSRLKVVKIEDAKLLQGAQIEPVEKHRALDKYNFVWFDFNRNRVTRDGKLITVYFEILVDAEEYFFEYTAASEEDVNGKAVVVPFETSTASFSVPKYNPDDTFILAEYDIYGKMTSVNYIDIDQFESLKNAIVDGEKLFVIDKDTLTPII